MDLASQIADGLAEAHAHDIVHRDVKPGNVIISRVTGVARTIGASISPLFAGLLLANPALVNIPFFIAGVLKSAYDLTLYRSFVAVQPPEEGRVPSR